MGYRFNSAAKSIKDGLSYNIGVMIPQRFTGLNDSFYLRVYQEIAVQLDHYGYFGILNILSSDEEEELSFPRVYSENKVDGIIILGQISKNISKRCKIWIYPSCFLISMMSMP
ncbi:hypothetical protein HMSSN139_20230 [Paenibacillus sp. HMSSN-139]|nr:hypothetical protein HMSSN139_20230 [Paenibacillus sp. HMSSN-139]